MSDIGIRFDGIFALAALALGAVIYFVIAMAGAAASRLSGAAGGRAWRVCRRAALLGAGWAALFAGLFGGWAQGGTYHAGVDWLDLAVFPLVAAFAAGCWWLSRKVA